MIIVVAIFNSVGVVLVSTTVAAKGKGNLFAPRSLVHGGHGGYRPHRFFVRMMMTLLL